MATIHRVQAITLRTIATVTASALDFSSAPLAIASLAIPSA